MTTTLPAVVRELEAHAAEGGWDQPARLFALVPTDDLVAAEPGLADLLADKRGGLTAVEQEPLKAEQSLEEVLLSAVWPVGVAGVAAIAERVVLPPQADDEVPTDPAAASAYANEHPDREEVRIVAAATRAGETFCAVRLRSHDDDASVMAGDNLVPGLLDLLQASLVEDPDPTDDPDQPEPSDEETQQ